MASLDPVRSDAPALRPPWGDLRLVSDEPAARSFGPRELWLLLRQGEIRLADRPAPAGPVPADDPAALRSDPPTEASAWSRWAVPQGATAGEEITVLLRPAFPERTVIVQPEVPFVLLPRAEARIFVRVPLRIQVVALLPDEAEVVLRSVETVVLSDTWWGGFLEGELCSWLTTSARRVVGPEHLEAHLAICPLHLVNQSRSDLRVEKLAFRVEHLSLYADGRGFWSDESRVRYQGDVEGSQIDMSGRPPEEADAPRLVHAPPLPVRGLRSLTFSRLFQLAPFGGGA